jgi:hypothetical protein
MKNIQGIVHDGAIHPSEPLNFEGPLRCVITVFDEDLEELRRLSQVMFEDAKQARLSALLQLNKIASLSNEQEHEIDALLTEVHQLAAKRARAVRVLEQLKLS